MIPAGFDLFVSKAKIIGDIFRNFFLMMRGEGNEQKYMRLCEVASPANLERLTDCLDPGTEIILKACED